MPIEKSAASAEPARITKANSILFITVGRARFPPNDAKGHSFSAERDISLILSGIKKILPTAERKLEGSPNLRCLRATVAGLVCSLSLVHADDIIHLKSRTIDASAGPRHIDLRSDPPVSLPAGFGNLAETGASRCPCSRICPQFGATGILRFRIAPGGFASQLGWAAGSSRQVESGIGAERLWGVPGDLSPRRSDGPGA